MAEATESQPTVSCVQCERSAETVNTPAEVTTAFLEPAPSPDMHEAAGNANTFTSESVDEEPAAQLRDMTFAEVPQEARAASAGRDPGKQTGFDDLPRGTNHRVGGAAHNRNSMIMVVKIS